MMPTFNLILSYLFSLLLLILSTASYANPDGIGQVIQIHTRLHSFVGKPSWLLIIRDIDNDQNLPYIYDISRGENYWIALTYGRDYLITVSRLQIETYRSRDNSYSNYRIDDFCHLESNGRIIRGESMFITIEGDLSPNSESYTCHVSKYGVPDFIIAKPDG